MASVDGKASRPLIGICVWVGVGLSGRNKRVVMPCMLCKAAYHLRWRRRCIILRTQMQALQCISNGFRAQMTFRRRVLGAITLGSVAEWVAGGSCDAAGPGRHGSGAQFRARPREAE